MSAVETARLGLATMIASGQLSPGDLLPGEVELCDQLGVSRSSLREAQKMLAVAGVLTSQPGHRSMISAMGPEEIMAGLNMVVPLLPLDRFIELLPLREVLEGYAAAMSAARFSDAECKQLIDLAHELAQEESSDRAQELDASFHRMIVEAAGDGVILALLSAIRRRGQDYRILEMAQGVKLKRLSDEAHIEMATAISNRDPESARFLAMRHVRLTRTWLEGLHPVPTVSEHH